MAELWTQLYILTLISTFCVFVQTRNPSYARRARTACYIPRGELYDRSLYVRAYGTELSPIPEGYRITNGKRIASICKRDIQIDAIMGKTLHRCTYGRWRPLLRTCIEKKRCHDFPFLPNATASATRQEDKTYSDGYEVAFTCDPGFLQVGKNTVTCKDGTWTTLELRCKAANDTNLCKQKLVNNADVTEISATRYKVTCHYGHTLADEQSEFQCNAGEWVGKVPLCKPVTCPTLRIKYQIIGDEQNGYGSLGVNNQALGHGTAVRVRCPAGQQPYKNINQVQCDNGNWKPFRPFCRRYCKINRKYWTYSTLLHGNIDGIFPHMARIQQRCIGEESAEGRICVNGRWRPRLKLCKNPGNGYVPREDYRLLRGGLGECSLIEGNSFEFMSLDETVLYDANDVINSDATIKQVCKETANEEKKHHVIKCHNGTWTPELRACPDRGCDMYINTFDIQNGTLNSPGYKDDFPQNTICNLTFNIGYFERISITFKQFEITGEMPNCSQSYLGYMSMDGELTKYCGDDLPPAIELYGPEAVITFNTLRAEVAYFKTEFEVITDYIDEFQCYPPDDEELVYQPIQDWYSEDEHLEITGCRSENYYLNGSELWFCLENGTWDSTAQCIEFYECILPEKEGVSYQIGNASMLFGSLPHGASAVVTATCGDVNDVSEEFQLIECENGTLSEEIITCRNETVIVAGVHCSPPNLNGVLFSPEKDLYSVGETVEITGCSDRLRLPVGATRLTCVFGGVWAGSVRCLDYCANGIQYQKRTEFAFFLRNTGFQRHQLNDIVESFDCYVECESHTDFLCRSIEYREQLSTCILIGAPPDPINFVQRRDYVEPEVFERACDDRCHIPDITSDDVTFVNNDGRPYVPRQRVLTGSVVKVTCQSSFRSHYITCLGGKWDTAIEDDFC